MIIEVIPNLTNIGNAIGWMLIHFIWQGAMLFIGYWIITRIFLKNKIHIRYWIGIAFIIMCLAVPIRELLIQLSTHNNISVLHQISINLGVIEPIGLLNSFDLFIAIVQKIIPYLVIIWIISITLISSHLAKSWFKLVNLSKKSTIIVPDNLKNKLNIYSQQLKLKFKPIITISKKIDIPATFGYFKPIILLPTSLINQLPQDQMEAILLHEICHIKRADFLHNILQLLVETLFFYHPLTNWISKDVRRVREQCCDELVLKLDADPIIYAKALTNIATIYNNISGNTSSSIQIAANDGELLSRIKFIMVAKKNKYPFFSINLSLLLMAVVLLVFNSTTKNKSNLHASILDNKTISTGIINKTLKNKNNHKSGYELPNINQLFSLRVQEEKQKTNYTKQLIRDEHLKTPELYSNRKATINKSNLLIDSNEVFVERIDVIQNIETNLNHLDKENIAITNANIKDRNNLKKQKVLNNVANNVNTYPKLIKIVNPKYKRSFRLWGVEGTVILSFNINQKGRVTNVKVDKNSTKKLINSSAIAALKNWRFDPSTINSTNINNRYQQIFEFTLENSKNTCRPKRTGTRINNNNNCN